MAIEAPTSYFLNQVHHAVKECGFTTTFGAMFDLLSYTARFEDARTVKNRKVQTF